MRCRRMRMARRRDLVQEFEEDGRLALRQASEQRALHRRSDEIRFAEQRFPFLGKAKQTRTPIHIVANPAQQPSCHQLVEGDCQIRHRQPEEPRQLPIRCVAVRIHQNQDGVVDAAQRQRLTEELVEHPVCDCPACASRYPTRRRMRLSSRRSVSNSSRRPQCSGLPRPAFLRRISSDPARKKVAMVKQQAGSSPCRCHRAAKGKRDLVPREVVTRLRTKGLGGCIGPCRTPRFPALGKMQLQGITKETPVKSRLLASLRAPPPLSLRCVQRLRRSRRRITNSAAANGSPTSSSPATARRP